MKVCYIFSFGIPYVKMLNKIRLHELRYSKFQTEPFLSSYKALKFIALMNNTQQNTKISFTKNMEENIKN
jgi:hypothetical protein